MLVIRVPPRLVATVRRILAASCFLSAVTLALGAAPRVLVPTALPPGVTAGDGCYDAAGSLHVVLALDGRCAYTRRGPGRDTFEAPRAIPSPRTPRFAGERRPHILVGSQGTLFVSWQAERGLYLAVSRDGGTTWSEVPTASLTGKSGIDVPVAAMSPGGVLHLVWVDERDANLPDDDVSRHLYHASSADAGRSFTAAHRITTDAARACPCCNPAIVAGSGGAVWIAYRSSVANVKETTLLHSVDAGRTFAARTLSNHGWVMRGCPMAGPSIAVSGARLVLSWTSEADMFTASSSDAGKTFTRPRRLGRGRFNAAAAGPSGDILMVWDEGPQTGAWWTDEPGPAPRLDIPPQGVLLAGPGGRFELLGVQAPGSDPHHR